MSGHSKWSTIKHKKAALDAKRGKVFTKLVKEITVTAREGGGDAAANPRLRTLLDKARAVNMPADNIQRAIKKGTGELPGQTYESYNYEGYGPGGIAIIVETLTDNKNRSVADLRHVFSRHAGRLGESGSVSWMFDHLGVIRVTAPQLTEEKLMELLLEHPVVDIIDEQESYMITVDPRSLDTVKRLLVEQHSTVQSAELEWVPKTKVSLSGAEEDRAMAFLEAMDELEDVQNVYTNL